MDKFKSIVTQPQKSDMGSGFGYYEFTPGDTLVEFLKWFRENEKLWGTIKILDGEDVIRYFDYDLWNDRQCYTHLCGWEYHLEIKHIGFSYCFMNRDIIIEV